MGVQVKRFPEYGVTLLLYSGDITPEAMRELLDALGPGDAVRCLHYADATADSSGIDIASYPALRRDIAAKLAVSAGGAHPRSALVSHAKTAPVTLDFWPRYVRGAEDYPVEPVVFDTLEAACDWYGLPEAGRRAVIEAAGA